MSSHDRIQAGGLLTLARFVANLKRVKRTGWLDRGVPESHVESVADHSLGVAILAWACAVEQRRAGHAIDPTRVALLAMIHDLPESEAGDTPPYDPPAIPPTSASVDRQAFLNRRHIRDEDRQAAKRQAEDASMLRLLTALPEAARSEMHALWEELQRGASPEAKLVKDVDRLETFLQSRAYLEQTPNTPMDSFLLEVQETIDDPLLIAIRDAALTDHPAN